jgi:hypothetical protein
MRGNGRRKASEKRMPAADGGGRPRPPDSELPAEIAAADGVPPQAGAEEQWHRIATVAYYKARQQAFAAGGEADDGPAVEREVRIKGSAPSPATGDQG